MSHAVVRTNFNSSQLVRVLADLAIADGVDSDQAFAQRLGQWVSFTDATALYTALGTSTVHASAHASSQAPKAQTSAKLAAFGVASEELNRVRNAVAQVIHRSCSPEPGATRIKFPGPQADAALEIARMYSPFHRFYLVLQKEMDTKAEPLRCTIREALASASPALKQLATLDAALDKILSERERRLLSTVPALLEKRFKQLCNAHQQGLVRTGAADDAATWMQMGGWLARFRDDLRSVVLAEWDVRLQPAMGLVEAFSNEVNGQHE